MEKEEKELMEEKPKKRRKKNGHVVLNTFLIILLLVAFLGIGFAVGSTEVFKKISTTNSKGETVIKKGKNESENLSIFDEKVLDSLKRFDQLGFSTRDSFELKITDFTKKDLIQTAINGLKYEQVNYCKTEEEATITITVEDLNKALKEAIPDGKLTMEDLKNNEVGDLKIKDDKIYVFGMCGMEGPAREPVEIQTEKAEIIGDKLYVYQKVAFGKLEVEANNEQFYYDYYKDKDFKTKEESLYEQIKPTWKLYNTYILTFKKNGDKFYFESSELQK